MERTVSRDTLSAHLDAESTLMNPASTVSSLTVYGHKGAVLPRFGCTLSLSCNHFSAHVRFQVTITN